jgi:hypothetical protein
VKKCPSCNEPYKPNSSFCVKCGKPIAENRFCPNPKCKNFNKQCDEDEVHCRICGTPTAVKYPGAAPEPEDKTWILIMCIILAVILFYVMQHL